MDRIFSCIISRKQVAINLLLVLLMCQCSRLSALAQDASASANITGHCSDNGSHHGHFANGSAGSPSEHVSTPINLDLSSTVSSVSFNTHCQSAPVNIQVAGVSQSVNSGQMLTPAEAVAAYQVLRGGVQNILLGADGAAIGGSMVIGGRLANNLNSLVIPQGVTVVDRASTLNLAGNLTNSGTLYAVSNNPAITAATISAANIFNQQGGLLTTVLPNDGSLLGSVSNLSLNLNALNNIWNAGIISSANNLNLTAGGSIINALPAGAIGVSPIIQSANNLNLNSTNIVNSGLIAANTGNINIAFQLGQSLVQNIDINNVGGTLQALNGAINIRDTLFSAKADINLTGGNLLSKELNLNSGCGVINADVNEISGIVNITSGAAYVGAKSPTVNLGNVTVVDDPIFYNSAGGFNITGTISTSGGDLAILAAGDITYSGSTGTTVINTTQTSGRAGDVYLVAGYSINVNGNPASNTCCSPGLTAGTITLNTSGAPGGSISIPTSTSSGAVGINAAGTGIGRGGDVYLYAYANGSTGGSVTFGTNRNISTAGGPTADAANVNGNITIIAPTSIAVRDLSTATSTSNPVGSGTINIYTAQPFLPAGTVDFSVSATSGRSTITTSAPIGPGAAVGSAPVLSASGTVTARALQTAGADILVLSSSDQTYTAAVNSSSLNTAASAGDILLASLGSLTLTTAVASGRTTGSGGNIALVSGGSFSSGAITSAAAGAVDNNGGKINVYAGTIFTTNASDITIAANNSESATGGALTLTSTLSTTGIVGGNGGDITLAAFQGTGGSPATNSGVIGTTVVTTSGGASGKPGNITILSGDTDAANGTAQITLGTVNESLGSNTTANTERTLIAAARPNLAADLVLSYATASPGANNFGLATSPTLLNGDLATGTISTNGRSLTMLAGGSIRSATANFSVNTTRTAGAAGGGSVLLASKSGGVNLGTGTINATGLTSGSGGSVTLIAGGSSSASVAGDIISGSITSTGAGDGSGGSIYLLAGTQFSASNTAVTVSSSAPESAAGGRLSTSGNITSSGVGAGNGGDLVLVAYNGTSPVAANSGTIILSTASLIQSTTTGTGRMGGITILAGDTNSAVGTAQLTVGTVTMSGGGSGASTGQSILLANTRANPSADISFAYSTAAPSGGTFGLAANPTLLNGDITIGNAANTGGITSSGRNVTLLAGGNIVPNATAFLINATGVTGNPNGGNVLIASQSGRIDLGTRTIVANGLTSGNGGNVTLVAGGSSAASVAGDISVSLIGSVAAGSGNGGTIYILAGTNFSVSNTGITISSTSPESAAGGKVSITGAGNSSASTGAGSGDGADIVVIAYNGTAPVSTNSGTITYNTGSNILSGATGTGRSGGITLLAGDTDAVNGTAQLTVGVMNLSGTGASTGQSVLLANTRANLSADVSFSFSTAAPSGGTFGLASNPTLLSGDITGTAITSLGHNITLLAGGNITANTTSFAISATGGIGNPNGGNILVASQSGRVNLGTGNIGANGVSAVTSPPGGVGGNISILAGGNASAAMGGDILLATASASGTGSGDNNGGNIFLAAGALFSVSNTAVTINSASAESVTGGRVNVTTNIVSAGVNNGNGGNVSLVAYQGTGTAATNSGTISTATITVTPGLTGSGSPGSILVLSGDTDTAAGTPQLTTAAINMGGGSGADSGQSLFMANSRPTLSSNVSIAYSTAAVTGGTYGLASSAVLLNGDLVTTGITTNGRSVTLLSGGNIRFASGTSFSITTNRSTGAGDGGSILAASQFGRVDLGVGAIGTRSLTSGSAGNVVLIAGGSSSASSTGDILLDRIASTGATSGNGGSVYLLSGTNFTASNTSITVSSTAPESAAGGKIALSGSLVPIDTSGAGSGSGGNIVLVAYNGTSPVAADSGTITFNTAGTVQSVAPSTGQAGSLTVLAGDSSAVTGSAQLTIGIITLTGSGSSNSLLLANTRASLSANTFFAYSTAASTGGTFGLASSPTFLNGDISAAQSITTSGNASILAGGNINVGSISTTNSLTITSSNAAVNIASGSIIAAGVLAGSAPSTGALSASDIQSVGGITITSGTDINIASSSSSATSLTSVGNNLTLTSNGNITLGTGSLSMTAAGGNVTALALGTVSGSGANNNIIARSVGTDASFTGGGIEIGSGLTSSTNIADYFANRTNTFSQPPPGALGANVVIYNNGLSGLVAANTSGGGTIDVGSPDINSPSIISVFGGAVIFDALGSGSSVNFRSNSTSYSFGLTLPPTPASTTTIATGGTFPFLVILPDISTLINTAYVVGVPTDRINMHIPVPSSQNSLDVNSQRIWFISQGQNQPFLWEGDSETVIIGQQGSKFARFESRTMILDQGKILVFVGKEDLTIDTAFGLVTVPARSSAIIDNTFVNVVRVISLSGRPSQMHIAENNQLNSIEVNFGEELVVSNDQASTTELMPTDGINRQRNGNARSINALKVEKNKINRKEIAEKDALLQNPSLQNKPLIDALKVECENNSGLPLPGKSLAPESNQSTENLSSRVKNSFFRPVAFRSSPKVTGSTITKPKLLGLNTSSALIKHDGNADISLQGNAIELKRGETFVFADKPTVVRAGQSLIKVGAGTMVLINKDDNALTTRNLWEPRNNSVHLQFGGSHINLGAGQECILATDDIFITAVYSRDLVGRRNIHRIVDAANHQHVSTCEISLTTLMTSSPVLSKMISNKESEDAKFTGKILKMAACIHQVTNSHGSYSSLSR